ncbi:glycosyltransferase family 1 protein [Actinospica sp. MGRD01-02]|uniref:Glycosyltransferase family 1 protein n=1 Tax=Actinospica acidithermotolerans TaxID=2828514 RepID=A0A941IFP7_9ACTN|nr:glycosyltransferase [Actinospica acidithermotolerans]MBR7826575.1 glycosyltransferase family 1 protein [Actinospica acidithermotolerans]
MRILFTFIGGSGHFRPLVPFARAAQAAGHTVAVAGSGRRYEEIRGAGFAAFRTSEPKPRAGVAAEAEPQLEPVDLAREEQVMRDGFAGRGARRHATAVREIALEWKPDVIVRDEVDFGSAIAAEVLGIPCVNVIVLLAGGLARPDVVRDPIAALRTEWGLVADPQMARLNGELVIMPAPPSLRDPRYPLPEGTFWCGSGDRVVRRERAGGGGGGGGRPLIYFTLGTFDTHRSVFERVLAGLRDLPVRVVTTVGRQLDPASFGPQPEHVRIESFIPQDEVLAEADMVIAHGGSGTLIGSLAHGIPSVLLPMGADQPHNTRRCVELGTAVELDPVAFRAEDAARAVTSLLSDTSYTAAARRIQDEINGLPEPAEALPLMEALAQRTRAV